MYDTILAVLLGGAVVGAFVFFLGRFYQQRQQVLEMRNTNTTLFTRNNELINAYNTLQKAYQELENKPVSVNLSYEQLNRIGEVTAAKIDGMALTNKIIEKKDKN